LLAQRAPVSEIPARVGQAIEAFDSVPLLSRALTEAGIEAPVTGALATLIPGELPLEEWIAIVRTTLPSPARWRPSVRPGFWRRLRERIRSWFEKRREDRHESFTDDEGGGATLTREREMKEREHAPDHRDGG
jgi:glycerol-3-phosphate dehydrogenase (NAD(P)+)